MNIFGTTGQERRAWLDRQGDRAGNALAYVLGPTGIPDRLNALAGALQYTDAGDYVEAADASQALWNDPSLANAARYTAAGAAMALPFIGSRGVNELSNNAIDWLGDEAGAVPLYGGGMSDPTQTGWTFRDMASPNRELTAADNQRISRYVGVREETLPIRQMYATQPSVNADFASTASSAGELPFVIRKNGRLYVQDGHHRIVRAAEEGANNARVRFMDLDNADMDMPLLDWRPERSGWIEADDALLRELGL